MHRFDSGIDLGNCMVPELDRMSILYLIPIFWACIAVALLIILIIRHRYGL